MTKIFIHSLFVFLLSSCAFCQGTTFSADTLLDKIYAVHATRSLPDSEYLRAGFNMDGCSPLEQALSPKARKTVHFALGELVQPVEGFMNWEDCPYAVVTPLRNLAPQLLNVNCYDTFILGDFKLNSQIYLIVPNDVAESLESHATIIGYDSDFQTLREAVDALIVQEEGWHIEMNSEDIEDELHPAYLNGSNVNVPEFFAPLKDVIPSLAVGLRFEPLDGEHYRLSQIEMNLMMVAMPILSTTYLETKNRDCLPTALLENFAREVNEHFQIWSSTLTNFKWGNESLEAYHSLASEIIKWACLTENELLIRKHYGKTLMSAPSDFLLKCFSLHQPEEVQNFIIQNKDLLQEYRS